MAPATSARTAARRAAARSYSVDRLITLRARRRKSAGLSCAPSNPVAHVATCLRRRVRLQREVVGVVDVRGVHGARLPRRVHGAEASARGLLRSHLARGGGQTTFVHVHQSSAGRLCLLADGSGCWSLPGDQHGAFRLRHPGSCTAGRVCTATMLGPPEHPLFVEATMTDMVVKMRLHGLGRGATDFVAAVNNATARFPNLRELAVWIVDETLETTVPLVRGSFRPGTCSYSPIRDVVPRTADTWDRYPSGGSADEFSGTRSRSASTDLTGIAPALAPSSVQVIAGERSGNE